MRKVVGGLQGVYVVTHQLLCWPGSAWFYRVYKADCSHPWCSWKELKEEEEGIRDYYRTYAYIEEKILINII